MTGLPTGPRGQALAAALTLLALAVLWLGAVSPALQWYQDRSDLLAQRQAVAARMTALAESLPELRRRAQSAATASPGVAVLDGATDAIAAARLQELVQGMARDDGASLNSLETLPAEQRGQYRRIALRVAVSAEWPVLVKLMASVEQAQPRMLIDDLQLRGVSFRVVKPAQPNEEQPVDASFTVVAFRSGAEPSGT